MNNECFKQMNTGWAYSNSVLKNLTLKLHKHFWDHVGKVIMCSRDCKQRSEKCKQIFKNWKTSLRVNKGWVTLYSYFYILKPELGLYLDRSMYPNLLKTFSLWFCKSTLTHLTPSQFFEPSTALLMSELSFFRAENTWVKKDRLERLDCPLRSQHLDSRNSG